MDDVIRWVLAGLCSLAGITVCVVSIMCSRTYKRRRMLNQMQHPNKTRDNTDPSTANKGTTVRRSEDSDLNSHKSQKRNARHSNTDTGGNNLEYRRLSNRNRSSATEQATRLEYCRFSNLKNVSLNLNFTNDKTNTHLSSMPADDSKTERRSSIFEELEIPMEQLHIPRVRLNRMPFSIDDVAIDLV